MRQFRDGWICTISEALMALVSHGGTTYGAMIFSDCAAFEAATNGLLTEGFHSGFAPTTFRRDFGDFRFLSSVHFQYFPTLQWVSEGAGAVVLFTELLVSFESPINTFGVDIDNLETSFGVTLGIESDTGPFDVLVARTPPTFPGRKPLFLRRDRRQSLLSVDDKRNRSISL